jgi:plasmid stability protein
MQAAMSTLYIRNLPEHVTAKLQELAKREGMSVNALAVRELTQVARAMDNATLLDRLHRAFPKTDVTIDDIVNAIHEGRADR